jgi:hypothetical protein
MISCLPGGKPEAHVSGSRAWRESVDLMAVNALAGRRPGGPMAGNSHNPVRAAHLGRCEPANCATASGSSRVRSEMKLVINGADVELDGRYAKTPLRWVRRDVVGLHGAKFGCGAGFCAARTVLIDGRNHEVLPDRDRAGGGRGNHHGRGGLRPGCRRRPHLRAVSAGPKPCEMRRARTVMSFALDPQVAEALHPVAVAMAGSTPRSAGDGTARPSANSGQPSSAFFGGRRSVK